MVTITRGVTHRRDPNTNQRCRIDTTKTAEDQRVVTMPPHIREDVKGHLQRYVAKGDEALLFTPARGGCHLHDRVFNDAFKKAAKDIGREDLSDRDRDGVGQSSPGGG